MATVIRGKPVIAGECAGWALVSHEPLSFWGGYHQATGEIIDRRHPLSGEIAAGRILALPHARGSSTTTAVLLEAVRSGAAPLALITTGIDHFLALASVVADEMYGKPIPLVAIRPDELGELKSGDWIELSRTGALRIVSNVPRGGG